MGRRKDKANLLGVWGELFQSGRVGWFVQWLVGFEIVLLDSLYCAPKLTSNLRPSCLSLSSMHHYGQLKKVVFFFNTVVKYT